MSFSYGNIRTLEDIERLAIRNRNDPKKLERYQKMARMAAGHPETDRKAALLLWCKIKRFRTRCQNALNQETADTPPSPPSGQMKAPQQDASKKLDPLVAGDGSCTTEPTQTDPPSS